MSDPTGDIAPEQKQRFGDKWAAMAITEPEAGSDSASIRTTAYLDERGDEWVLNASKVMISLAEHTRMLILLVTSEEGPTLFLLDMDELRDRIEIQPIEMITNRMTTSVFIDDLRVPDSMRLGPAAPFSRRHCLRPTIVSAPILGPGWPLPAVRETEPNRHRRPTVWRSRTRFR